MFCSLLQRPDGSFYIAPPTRSSKISPDMVRAGLHRIRAHRTDTPFAAFLRIVHNVHLLPTSKDITITLYNEIECFWYCGITGAAKFDYFHFGGRWFIKDIPDPRGELKNDPLLCAIAASAAEQMAEVFNWRISLGVRRDLRLRLRKPYWEKYRAVCDGECAGMVRGCWTGASADCCGSQGPQEHSEEYARVQRY